MVLIVGEVLKRLEVQGARCKLQGGEREACLLVDFPVESHQTTHRLKKLK